MTGFEPALSSVSFGYRHQLEHMTLNKTNNFRSFTCLLIIPCTSQLRVSTELSYFVVSSLPGQGFEPASKPIKTYVTNYTT